MGRGDISVPGSLCHPPGLSWPISWCREYRSRFTNTETLLFCMRVMVGVIILYDHVHPVGAFAKTSKIDVSGRGVHWGGGHSRPAHPNVAVMPGGPSPCGCPLRGHLCLSWSRGEHIPPQAVRRRMGRKGDSPPMVCLAAHGLSCSPHQMKGCIKVLKDQPSTSTEGLLNALR